jgi:hypothetical protein
MNTISNGTYMSALGALEKLKTESLKITFDGYFVNNQPDFIEKADTYNHRVLYLLLQQLKMIIDPLLIDITHIDYSDASDKYFLFTSGYFSILLKQIEQQTFRTYTPPNESHLTDILNVVNVPLTRYLQKRGADKKSMEELLESTVLALSDIESQYLFEKREELAIPLSETTAIFEGLNEFIKAYKKKIEGDEFDRNVAIGGLQRKFSNEDNTVDLKPEQTGTRYSKEYYILKVKGDYFYDGNLVEISKTNANHTVLDVLFENMPHGGLLKYKDFYKLLKRGFPRATQKELHTKIVRAFGDKQNGLLSVTNIVHYGKPLFVVEKYIGIKFNNQR